MCACLDEEVQGRGEIDRSVRKSPRELRGENGERNANSIKERLPTNAQIPSIDRVNYIADFSHDLLR